MQKEMTTEEDLKKMAAQLHIPLLFVGFRDMLPKQPKPGGYIINLQASEDGMGTHWTSMYLSNNPKNAFYYDSFGGPPPEEAEQLMKRWAPSSHYSNPYTIQDIDNGFCGQYCIDFLKNIMHNPTKNGFEHFLSKYHKHFRLQQKKDSKI